MATTLSLIIWQRLTIVAQLNTYGKKRLLQGRWLCIKGHTIRQIHEKSLLLLRRKMVNLACKQIKETILVNLIDNGVQEILIRVYIDWIKMGSM
jgi:hypothetical protein